MLTPLNNAAPGSPEERYNNAHTSIRSLVERCNGLLKNRFRCLLKHRVLHYAPEKASKIINACVVLHNMCIEHKIELEFDEQEQEIQNDIDLGNDIPNHNLNEDNQRRAANLDAGNALRHHIIQNYFT